MVAGVCDPSDRIERGLFDTGARLVAGIDEVGRGAWAGPLTVGIAVVDGYALARMPDGVRDSKMLSPKRREALEEPLKAAVVAWSVGDVNSRECDSLGMSAALVLAAERAFAALSTTVDAVILDGRVDFARHTKVVTMPGADRDCISVAAASILAKVHRDRIMTELAKELPGYGFEKSKGYPSPIHVAALEREGLTSEHRLSWSFASKFRARSTP